DLNKKSDYFIDIEEYEKAFGCSIIAANLNDTYAEGSVGWFYQNGYGVDKNYEKAIEYLKRAKNGDSDYARNLLAEHYANGWGVPQNYSKALSYYTKAANNGDDFAQGQLGYYYYYGDEDGNFQGVEKNYKLAFFWFKKSAEQGNTYSESWLGHMYLFGEGTEVDLDKALKFSQLAADKGDEYAQSNIGYLYEWGEGVEKNIDKAIKFYTLSADQGNKYSSERLEILLADNKNENNSEDSSSGEFITKKVKNDENNTNEIELVTENLKDQKSEEKNNIASENSLQSKFIPIEEFTNITVKTKLKKDHASESQTIIILSKGLEVYAIRELADENVPGEWVNIEVEIENQILTGYVLKNKIELSKIDSAENKTSLKNNKKYDIEWGEYYAIVIGNDNYDNNKNTLNNLKTAINDAEKIGNLLRNKYGFKTEVIKNATLADINQTIKKYRSILTENDNLLIYYAGHGTVDSWTKEGYWLPVDAQDNNEWTWFDNRSLISLTKSLNAKHIIVIADSCFSGSLFSTVDYRSAYEDNNLDLENVFFNMNKKTTRVAITSGNYEFVPDSINDSDHSPFATVLIDILNSNNDVLPAGDLFSLVRTSLPKLSKKQNPVYGEFDFELHQKTGDFLFVPLTIK
ncbi:caspase family protein, partial [Pelagibacteraceae bacterium]|nr:caspase family protein [Pelagibacteraceae bacterium]